jgi:hypothetical protein
MKSKLKLFQQALPILQRFDRFERRVTARRNRAIRLCFEKILGT